VGKYSNLITIINLLHSRKTVPGELIRDMCNVAPRTVFRYIRDLSEANVPIYYDRAEGGYKLTRTNDSLLEGLAMDELVSILFALRYTALRMNDAHHESINELVRKLISRQVYAIDEILEHVTVNLTAEDLPWMLSQRLNSIAVQVAAATNKDIRLTIKGGDNSQTIRLSAPSLSFEKVWKVCGRIPSGETMSHSMEQVESVRVVE
jgi:hypothetical protein